MGVILATLYQLLCTQQQGITSMVVAQARVPTHLGVHSWAAKVSMTQLFAQVILGLGSLSGLSPVSANASLSMQTSQTAAPTEQVQYTAIPPEGSTMVSTSLFPGKQVRRDSLAAWSIYLGNDTDSGISGIDPSTPVKAPGSRCQPLASTPKPKPKLLVTAQQQRNELAALQQGAPHAAHTKTVPHRTSRAHALGMELPGSGTARGPRPSGNSSFVNVDEHTEYTTTALTRRDALHWPISDNDDIVSIHDDQPSDEEMVSMTSHPEQHTKDSSADSAAEGSNHHTDSQMESDNAWDSDHGLDPGTDHSSGSDDNSRSQSSSSDDNGGDFADMFRGKSKHSHTPRNSDVGHIPSSQRGWSHSHTPMSGAGPEKPRTRNGTTLRLWITCPIRINRIGKRRSLNRRRLPPKAIPGEVTPGNVPMTGQPIDLGRS